MKNLIPLFLLLVVCSLENSHAQSSANDKDIIVKVVTNRKVISKTDVQATKELYEHALTGDEFINLSSFNELLQDSEYVSKLDVCYTGDQDRALEVIKAAYIKNEGAVNSYYGDHGIYTVELLEPSEISMSESGTVTIDSITHDTYHNGVESTGSTDVYFVKCDK